LSDWNRSSTPNTRALPWRSLVPRFVIMFRCAPDPEIDASPPPVMTCISWNMSKS
jgi:hypothetical protein